MKHLSMAALAALGVAMALSLSVRAEALDGVLAEIRDTGEITLGHRDVSIPFSYLDDKQQPVGFAMDLCGKVIEAVKAELHMPSMRVKLRPVQLRNQMSLIQDGTVDIVCGPASNTLERQKLVTFSNTIFVSSIRAVVRNSSTIRTFEDMAGKAVSLTAASTSIDLLRRREQDHVFVTDKVISPDHSTSFMALASGRTEAFVMDDILLTGLVANSSKPARWRIIDDALSVEPYGLILPKDDPSFRALVNRTLGELVESGDFERLYDKWFVNPIPPKGINLNFAMPAALKQALAEPNDHGV